MSSVAEYDAWNLGSFQLLRNTDIRVSLNVDFTTNRVKRHEFTLTVQDKADEVVRLQLTGFVCCRIRERLGRRSLH